MDQLIDNETQKKPDPEMDALLKEVDKNRTQQNRILGFCWDYDGMWTDTLLDKFYTTKVANGKRLIQKCKNKRCVNPEHLIEVTQEVWFRNSLDADMMWMDVV